MPSHRSPKPSPRVVPVERSYHAGCELNAPACTAARSGASTAGSRRSGERGGAASQSCTTRSFEVSSATTFAWVACGYVEGARSRRLTRANVTGRC
jgi:hypothetical protein